MPFIPVRAVRVDAPCLHWDSLLILSSHHWAGAGAALQGSLVLTAGAVTGPIQPGGGISVSGWMCSWFKQNMLWKHLQTVMYLLVLFFFSWLLRTSVLFFHELLIIQFCLYQLVLQYRQKYFVRWHRYGSFNAKCLLCLLCAPPCTTWCCLRCEERRAGHLLVVTLLYQDSGWQQGSADYHWESCGALEDKELAHGGCMTLSGEWWHQFTTKEEILSCLEERAK